MSNWLVIPASGILAAALAGCARVDARPDYERARNLVADATGQRDAWPEADHAAHAARIAEMLRTGLTASDAARLALINNPSLQASYRLIGMSRADVVQSGLFSNPTLAFSIQFPEGGGRANVQASLAQNIVDLWQIPVRREAANRALDEAILDAARRAAQLAADTKLAFAGVVAADAEWAIAQQNQQVAERLLEVTQARQAAGAVGELDVNLARSPLITAGLDVSRARLGAHGARRSLAILLGLTDEAEHLKLRDVSSPCPRLPDQRETIVNLARANRLDLQGARQAAAADKARLALEYRKVLPEFSVGPMLQRNERRAMQGRNVLADTARASIANGALTAPDIQSRAQRDAERRQQIDAILGPAFSMTLPLFDQNQAQIARAEFAYEQAVLEAEAIDRAIVQETRQRLDQAVTACELADSYANNLIPQMERNLELSQATYQIGRTTLLTVLDAQRTLLLARLSLTRARQDASAALVELERVTARPLDAIVKEQPK